MSARYSICKIREGLTVSEYIQYRHWRCDNFSISFRCWSGCRTGQKDLLEANVASPVGGIEAHWLQEYSVETAIATIIDGSDSLKINTQHLRELSFRVGSIYEFINELLIQPDNEAVLQARVGRNVDGIDLNLYYQSLQLLRQFQAHHLKNPAT
ncbi:hypothetical protein CerSpe_088030 [Prunus speciosa]